MRFPTLPLLSLLPALALAAPLQAQSPARNTAAASAARVDAQWMDAEGVSVPVPPREHPRLFLRQRDIQDLRRRTTHPRLKPVWDRLQQAGKSDRQLGLEADAVRYLLSGDKALARRTAAAGLKLLQEAQFDLKAQDVSRPMGRLMVTGAIVYDWCYDGLNAAQKEAFVQEFLRLARLLECRYPPRQSGFVTGHYSEWMLMRDMMSAGIAIYHEFPEMYRLAANRFFKGFVPVRNWWYAGHAFHQGSAYAETRFSSDLYPLWTFDRLGAGNVYNPSQQFVPYQWIYMRRPDGQLLRSGDGQSKPPKLRSLLTASYYGDCYVMADYLRDPGIDIRSAIFEFLWSDPDLQPCRVDDLPLSRYMGGPYGWMVARTGWGEDSVIAEMKVNVYNFGNHQHLDAGSFQIYHKGPLAIDSGLYSGIDGGYMGPHNTNYARRTIAHNTLLIYDPDERFVSGGGSRSYINDGGQKFTNGWRESRTLEDLMANYQTGEVLGYGFGPDARRPAYTYLKGDITRAYSSKVREVRRSFAFLNLDGAPVPAVLVVFDRVVSANPEFKKHWLLHSMEKPEIEGNSIALTLSQRGWTGKLVNTVLAPRPDNAQITPVGGPGKEFWVFGKNFPNRIRRGNPIDFEIGEWRVEVSPREAAVTDLFLNVLQVMEKGVRPMEATRIDSPELVGVRVGGRVVLFNRISRRAGRAVSFSLPQGESYKVLVTDLAAGNWQVWRDGRVADPAMLVTEDAGTFYFEGPGGEYVLRR